MPNTMIPQIKIVNAETGEEIIRDATPDEIAQIEKDKAESIKLDQIRNNIAKQKSELLDRLGITQEEFRLLLG